MALWDEVAARYNEQELIQLTRAGEALSETTVNTTRADAAVADVEGEFLTQQCGTYDGTDARHVSLAVEGVIVRLKSFAKAGDDKAAAKWTAWKASLHSTLSAVTLRSRVQPKTSSPSIVTLRRPFDPGRFEDYIPDAPPTGQDE